MAEYIQNTTKKSIDPRGVKLAYALCIIFSIGLILFISIPPLLGIWTWWDLILIVAGTILYITPAYVTNASMVYFGRNSAPIDGGRKFIDGKRIFGDGKTWRGLIWGIISGFIVGFVFLILSIFIAWPILQNKIGNPLYPMLLDDPNYLNSFFNPPFLLGTLRIIFLCIGAPVGDLIGSFIKRRFNLERGAPAPILDQLDFLLGAIFMAYIIFPLWWMYIIFASLLTILLHIGTNTFAYKIGFSKEPW